MPSRIWEEIIAGAFVKAGFDEVVLTPRSGDHGRDVIAIKNGIGSIKVLDSVKAYKPGNLVTKEEVHALMGVVALDPNASKGYASGQHPGQARRSAVALRRQPLWTVGSPSNSTGAGRRLC
ncbi:restriction endonuclease [Bradyrhizobium sp. DASA03120]|uniref:restriction endonuclease n=1 Tax=Bradyrhizobium sp. SMVTL-02 TaxID=3395917 RepID=UPI003F73029D